MKSWRELFGITATAQKPAVVLKPAAADRKAKAAAFGECAALVVSKQGDDCGYPEAMNTTTSFSAGLVLCIGAFSLAGCVTATRGTKETLVIETDPPGAIARVEGQQAVTPCSFEVSRTYDGAVYILKSGFKPVSIPLTSQKTGGAVTTATMLMGGAAGILADSMSGATRSLSPNPVRVTLEKLVPGAAPAPSDSNAPGPPDRPARRIDLMDAVNRGLARLTIAGDTSAIDTPAEGHWLILTIMNTDNSPLQIVISKTLSDFKIGNTPIATTKPMEEEQLLTIDPGQAKETRLPQAGASRIVSGEAIIERSGPGIVETFNNLATRHRKEWPDEAPAATPSK